MYCSKCGKVIPDNATFCSECGNVTAVTDQQPVNSNQSYNQNSNGHFNPIIEDKSSTVANIASCCFPLAGLILYLVWKDTKPQSASTVCKFTIGGVVGITLIYILFFIIGFANYSGLN